MTLHPCCVGNHVSEFGYEKETGLMGVRFHNSKATYFYDKVPQEVFDAFMASPSPGRFVQKVLGPHFETSKA